MENIILFGSAACGAVIGVLFWLLLNGVPGAAVKEVNDAGKRCKFSGFFGSWIARTYQLVARSLRAENSIAYWVLSGESIKNHLRRGEEWSHWQAEVWIAREVVRSAVTAFCGFFFLLMMLPINLCIVVALFAAIVSYRSSVKGLVARSKNWLSRFQKRLSFSIDLLALTMKSGSTMADAFKTLVDENKNHPIGQEFGLVTSQVNRNLPFKDSLENMRMRMRDSDVNEIVFTIIHAEKLGTASADAFLRLADQMRLRRSQRAERAIGQAKTMLAFPNFLFFLASLLAVAGPFVLVPLLQHFGQ